MFGWYRQAEMCYAYLSDVPSATGDHAEANSAFRCSKWFTRGWTLQELLAPLWVQFYDVNWNEFGTKESLEFSIKSVTGITYLFNYDKASVAQKMSWASKRETTRPEDQAYCLMGLFDIHMPLLYGEGQKAFLRLQREILSKTEDESILAWGGIESRSTDGLLANTPALFGGCGDVQCAIFDAGRPPPIMTNKGLRLELLIVTATKGSAVQGLHGPIYLAPLNCTRSSVTIGRSFLALCLRSPGQDDYERLGIRAQEFPVVNLAKAKSERRTIYIKQHHQLQTVWFDKGYYARKILFRISPLRSLGFQVSEKFLRSAGGGAYWDLSNSEGPTFAYFLLMEDQIATAALLLARNSTDNVVATVAVTPSRGRVDVGIEKGNKSLQESIQAFRSVRMLEIDRDDRVPRHLVDGRPLSVAISKQIHTGGQIYVVDFKIGG